MKPGETVVAAVPHQNHILVFGSQGTVLCMAYNSATAMFVVRKELELPCY